MLRLMLTIKMTHIQRFELGCQEMVFEQEIQERNNNETAFYVKQKTIIIKMGQLCIQCASVVD